MDASEFTLCPLTKAEDRRRSDNDRAKKAHDDLIAAAYRAKADALEIEALAKRRRNDEYDAAQDRGDAVGPTTAIGKMQRVINPDPLGTLAEYGLTKQQIRDAEKADPGIVRRTVDRPGSKPYKGSGYAAASRSG